MMTMSSRADIVPDSDLNSDDYIPDSNSDDYIADSGGAEQLSSSEPVAKRSRR